MSEHLNDRLSRALADRYRIEREAGAAGGAMSDITQRLRGALAHG